MRDAKGRFIKGFRSSIETEIKKGQRFSKNTEIKEGQRLSFKTEFKKGFTPWNKGKKVGYFGGGFKKGHPKPKNAFKWGKKNKHPNWKGGKIKDRNGYMMILKPEHPFCNSRGYIQEHRIVIQGQIKRFIKEEEHCHHINKIKTDNRVENLMLFSTNSAHQRFHGNPNNVKPEEIIFDGRKII